MDFKILSHSELLNYAQPETQLEQKLFDAALHFQQEAKDAKSALNQAQLELEDAEFEQNSDLEDELGDLKASVMQAIESIEAGKINEAKLVLEGSI